MHHDRILADHLLTVEATVGAALQLDYTYRYAHRSELIATGPERGLRLATFGGAGTELCGALGHDGK